MKKIDERLLLEMLQGGRMTQLEMARHFGVAPSAITKAKKKILSALSVPESFKSLTDKEKRFVLARVDGKTQTQAALSSFECGTMDSAKSIGSQLAKRPDIQKAIYEIMEEEGLDRRHRIRKLKNHIDNQTDRQASLKGIDIANKMEGIYVEKQINLNIDYHEEFMKLSREIDVMQARVAEVLGECEHVEEKGD